MSKKTESVKRTPVDIPIEQLTVAPWNPREEITPESVQDLVPSIKSTGLIQRIAVVKDKSAKTDRYIVCAGNRRFVACCEAGMKTVPCELFACSEAEARKMTLLENLKRKDTEPIYVAELIRILRDKDKMTFSEIAAELSCSVKSVERRAKLIDLCPEWVEVAKHKTLSVTTELLENASRYTIDIQKGAYDEIMRTYDHDRRLSWTDVAKEFESRTCDLTKAIFPRKKCASCPNNTACNPTLWDFGEDAKFGMCLDSRCFKLKRDEAENHEVEKLKADGVKVAKVRDYYSVPDDHTSVRDINHPVACVFRDYEGKQKILFAAKDPTEFEDETKSVNSQDKERKKKIKDTQKQIKEWEEEYLRQSIENRTWNLSDGEFAAFIFSIAHAYGFTGYSSFQQVDSGLRYLSKMVVRNNFDHLDRERYLQVAVNEILDCENSHVATISLFEEANNDLTSEQIKLVKGN